MTNSLSINHNEMAVGEYFERKIPNTVALFPAKSNNKGFDLVLCSIDDDTNKHLNIQVKGSRAYTVEENHECNALTDSEHIVLTGFFGMFTPHKSADWFIIVTDYSRHFGDPNGQGYKVRPDSMMLAFTYDEMVEFLDSCKTRKGKKESFYSFDFDEEQNHVWLGRGDSERSHTDVTKYLIKNRLEEIKASRY